MEQCTETVCATNNKSDPRKKKKKENTVIQSIGCLFTLRNVNKSVAFYPGKFEEKKNPEQYKQ